MEVKSLPTAFTLTNEWKYLIGRFNLQIFADWWKVGEMSCKKPQHPSNSISLVTYFRILFTWYKKSTLHCLCCHSTLKYCHFLSRTHRKLDNIDNVCSFFLALPALVHSRTLNPVNYPNIRRPWSRQIYAHAQLTFPELLFVFPPVERLAKTKSSGNPFGYQLLAS